MPVVSINLKELSGVTPGTANLKNAVVWFYPYDAYGSPLVTTDKLVVTTTLGVAAPFIPETPVDNYMWAEIRGVRLSAEQRKRLVQIPAGDCNLFDLERIDPKTLDPLAPLSPAWIADLAAAVALLEAKDDLDDDTGALVANPASATALAVAAKIAAAIDAVTTSDIIATAAAGALTRGKWTRVDASAGTKAMTLANATAARQVTIVEKSDSTSNTVTIALGLRGSAGSLTLESQFQTFVLVADDDLNWYVEATHTTKAARLAEGRLAFDRLGAYGQLADTASGSGENLEPVIVSYFPVAGSSYTKTGDTLFSDVDATNLTASIVVPPSGKIEGALTGYASVTGGTTMRWGVADSLGALTESQGIVCNAATAARLTHRFTITKDGAGAALVPGRLLTVKWQMQVNNAAQTGTIAYGGLGTGTVTGGARIELRPLSNRLTSRSVTSAVTTSAIEIPHDVAPNGLDMVGQVATGSFAGRICYSTNAGTSWTNLPNAVSPAGTAKVWYAGDGEILVIAGLNPGVIPGTVWKSVGWATNPATATFTKVLTANNASGLFDVYFASYSGNRMHGKVGVVSEYGPKVSSSDMARYVYATEDYGSSWRSIFDLYAQVLALTPGWNGSSAHVHSAQYDKYWDAMWVIVGDYNGTVLPYTFVSFNWRSASPTWTVVYAKHQFTSVIPMRGCVLFVTDQGTNAQDGIGNGIMRLRRGNPDTLGAVATALESAYIYDSVGNQTILGATWTRHNFLADAPTLIGLGETVTSGPCGRILVTYDGFTFKEIWTAPDTGTVGGVATIVGPIAGKITAGYQNGTDGFIKELVTLTIV